MMKRWYGLIECDLLTVDSSTQQVASMLLLAHITSAVRVSSRMLPRCLSPSPMMAPAMLATAVLRV